MLSDIGFIINKNNIFLFDDILEKNKSNLWIEIGSGNGDYIVELAKRERKIFFIAIEIKFKRIYKTLRKLKKARLDNLLLVHGDGSVFVEFLLGKSMVDVFMINFPDPWYKKRHNRRRLINKNFYKVMFEKLKNNGKICIATDFRDYANVILNEARETKLFENVNFSDKWLNKDIFTKYEKDYIAQGKNIYYLQLNKLGCF